MLRRLTDKVREYLPLPALIAYIVCITAGIIHIISCESRSFSDFFNRYISSFFRALLAKLTNLLPFSLAEAIIMFLPVLVTLMIIFSLRAVKRSIKDGVRYICGLLAVTTMFYTLFVLCFATAYQGTTLEYKLKLERREITADELYKTAALLLDKTEGSITDVSFKYAGASVMPYTLTEMSVKLNDAYEKAYDKYPFLSRLRSNVKFIVLSEPMTYTHISGVYTYYTGEANINSNFPDYSLPYTAAHELSHQRGIAREDEANFMAFLICMESDDPYIIYSGYMNLFEYVFTALYGADSELYYKLLDTMDLRVRYELISYSEFFDKYRKSVASQVSGAVNDTFLKSQGQTDGTKSYGRVVDLAAAYFRGEIDE